MVAKVISVEIYRLKICDPFYVTTFGFGNFCTFTDRFPGKIRIDCIVRNEPRALIFVIAADRTRLARVGDVDKGFYRRAE